MKIYSVVFMMVMLLFACKEQPAPEIVDGKMYFGEKITETDAQNVGQLIADMAGKESAEGVKVRGTVQAVCQTKGCWMNIAESTDSDEKIFVKFLDDIFGSNFVLVFSNRFACFSSS